MILLLALQVAAVAGSIYWLIGFYPHILVCVLLFLVVMVLYLLNSEIDPTAKITWLVVIMLLPVFGAALFWYTQSNIGYRALKKSSRQLMAQTADSIRQEPQSMMRLAEDNPGVFSLARYLSRCGCFPVYDKTSVTYFPSGEEKWHEMLRQLRQAERFIFLEYFIIDEGIMWGEVLEILSEKAAQGVEIRVMYDGTCEFSTLPHNYPKRLNALGIQCKTFAPVTPFVSTHYNYRDHRKILVIDGRAAFTGGVNLADEYINKTVKYGHWKDTAVMLQGEAVKSFTLMFLQMWNIGEKTPEFDSYLAAPACPQPDARGYVIPYGDCPVDQDKVGERVYMDILNRAQRYVHIMSPYLILDGEMETALKFAAERGVEVSLILPGIPDKPAPYALAKTHYRSLLDSGIKIYEYVPGFVHAKVFVSDDREAVVGTINLDYRSLYHHFECAAYLLDVDCIPQIEQDFENTLTECRQVSYESIRHEKWTRKLTGRLLKAIAPLL
ncbi:MAG: cardiolipin synthase [Oscillospiraceae bacterium]